MKFILSTTEASYPLYIWGPKRKPVLEGLGFHFNGTRIAGAPEIDIASIDDLIALSEKVGDSLIITPTTLEWCGNKNCHEIEIYDGHHS